MLRYIMRNEWRGLAADRTLWAVAALLAVMLLYGAFNGSRWSSEQVQRQEEWKAERQERLAETRADLVRIEAGGDPPGGFFNPRNPAQVGQNFAAAAATMPPAPLASLSVGQSDLLPSYYKVTLDSREALLAGDELENPTNLLAGRFDVAFVLVFLYPLVILALSYNLLSGEKEQGTLALALAQPVSLRKLASGKILARGGLVFGLTVMLTFLGAVVGGIDLSLPGAAARLLAFFGITAIYGLFWFALALLVNAWGRASQVNAMILAGTWLTLALIIPSAVDLLASTLHPVPSRVEMIQAGRTATQEATARGSQLLGAYFADHPEMAPQGEIDAGDYYTRKYVIEDEVAAQVAPLTARFEDRVRGQQAIVGMLQYLSPAVLAQQAYDDLAGTSYARFAHFQAEVERFAAGWKAHFLPMIFQKTTFTASALDALPQFEYVQERSADVASRVAKSATVILALAGLLLGWAAIAMLRYRPVG